MNFRSYGKRNIWELQLSNGNLNMNDNLVSKQGSLEAFFLKNWGNMVELHNWLPELFLVIDIKIEYSRTN